METLYIKTVLKHEGIDVDPDDVPWIQFLLQPLEPTVPKLTPDYMKAPFVTRPTVYQQTTFSWGHNIR